ncbi:MAG: hypothetical protein IJW37_07195, partial [Lachnospiraceae bacterium]|nr:hypothetical protein [Lachnospiraceae bacterium]
MYKKILYTILSVVTMLSIAACGSSDSGKEPTATPKATEAPKNDDKGDTQNQDKDLSSLFDELENRLNGDSEDTPVVIPTEVPTDEDEDFDWSDEDVSSSATAVTDGVIVDNEQCAFKIVSVDADNFWGYTLNVQLENKTNLNLSFSMDDVYVDGVYCDPYWYCDVEPGETVTDEVSFYTEDFEALGITEPTSITFLLTVYDDDNWEADNLVEDTYVFYPEGEENAVVYEYDFDADDTVLVENENITMAFLNYEYDEDWGYIVDVYMENHT